MTPAALEAAPQPQPIGQRHDHHPGPAVKLWRLPTDPPRVPCKPRGRTGEERSRHRPRARRHPPGHRVGRRHCDRAEPDPQPEDEEASKTGPIGDEITWEQLDGLLEDTRVCPELKKLLRLSTALMVESELAEAQVVLNRRAEAVIEAKVMGS